MVPRGTVRESSPVYGADSSALVRRVYLEAGALRATSTEADFLVAALSLPQARALVAETGAGEAEALTRSLLDWLAVWIKQREAKPKKRAAHP